MMVTVRRLALVLCCLGLAVIMQRLHAQAIEAAAAATQDGLAIASVICRGN